MRRPNSARSWPPPPSASCSGPSSHSATCSPACRPDPATLVSRREPTSSFPTGPASCSRTAARPGSASPGRPAVRRAIARLHLVPVGSQSGARPHRPRPMYRAYVKQSQVFVGIYWQRYGWVAPGMEISGLEDEYRLAAGKPMLLYLKRPAPDIEPRLAAMIDGIRAAGTVSYRAFATPRELERLLADDLAVLLSESFAGAAAYTPASAGPGEPGAAELPAGTVTF